MQITPQPDFSIENAFKTLALAHEAHEDARGSTTPFPRIDRYYHASQQYAQAALQFAKVREISSNLVTQKRAEAWQYYCLAMQYGDRANAKYFNPSSSRQQTIDDIFTATRYIHLAQETMPWEDIEERDERVKWKVLEHSFRGLRHRAKAQKLQKEKEYEAAENEFLIAANAHSNAATIAESLGDQATYQRAMSRVWSATSNALECRAMASTGREREKYLGEAQRAVQQALEFRPHWAPLGQIFAEIVSKQQEIKHKQASQWAWIQIFIGFLMALVANAIFYLLQNRGH